MTLLYFILVLGVIVFVHELGHFVFAKLFGVHVYEFSIGMGPIIWSSKAKGNKTNYNLRAIPIGGFVQLAGEEVDDDNDVPKDSKLYSKPIWQRFLIMSFGAINNFILAFLILFFIALFNGAANSKPIISKVDVDSAMYEAGVIDNDIITSINGSRVSTIDDAILFLNLAGTKETTFKVKRNEELLEFKVTPKKVSIDGQDQYKYGIEFSIEKENGFIASLKFSLIKIKSLVKQMVVVIFSLITGKLGLGSLAGPVGIYSLVGQEASFGILNLLSLIALLSVNVGFINLLPFPAFDGGRILFLIIEKIKGSPVSPKVENTIHAIGFILLLLLLVVISINDIGRLF